VIIFANGVLNIKINIYSICITGLIQANLAGVIEHLQPYRQKLESRANKQEWYELQQPQMRYTVALNQPKIVFPDIAKESRFTFDTTGAYVNNTVYFIPTDDLYLLGILNSSIIWEYCKERLTVLGDANKGGRLRFFRQVCRKNSHSQRFNYRREGISKLVQKCLDAKGVDCEAWEKEISDRVAALYGTVGQYRREQSRLQY
jgi:hypothetical protein